MSTPKAKNVRSSSSLTKSQKKLDTVLGSYLEGLRSAVQSEVSGINTSVNWALSMTLAVVAFVAQAFFGEQPPSAKLLIFALVLVTGAACMLGHFAIRTAKSYLNIIRFATVERACLIYVDSRLNSDSSAAPIGDTYHNLISTIFEYHICWRSPLRLRVILRKTLLEFGFVYHLLAILAVGGYLASLVYATNRVAAYAVALSLILATWLEVRAFRRSAYGRSVRIDRIAQSLA